MSDEIRKIADAQEAAESAPAVRLKADGTPRQKPGPKPGSVRKAPAPRKTAAATARKPAESGHVDYRPALLGLAQLPQMALGLAARIFNRPKLALDGLAVGIHAPVIADALNETAKTEAQAAALLDKLMVVGPWGLVIAAALPLGAQFLVNHEVAAANSALGTLTPEELVETAQERMRVVEKHQQAAWVRETLAQPVPAMA